MWEGVHGATPGNSWSGEPNAALVGAVRDLDPERGPGRALDLGCGEGGDAVWLARWGWRVTGADVSATALARARALAEEAGVAGRVHLERHDLGTSLPAGEFDLVCTSFLHSPAFLDRPAVLRRAAAAVAPGGHLVVVGHVRAPGWRRRQQQEEGFPEVELPTPEQVREQLALPAPPWRVVRSELLERPVPGPRGEAGTAVDGVLVLHRAPVRAQRPAADRHPS
ncbi:methyltransferase domain-containing protein [Kineococcus sp. T13]|nr:methyltransferase domain-containing protein [Kineococcus vitellinus]